MSKEHPVKQAIFQIAIMNPTQGYGGEDYCVGKGGVKRIEACTKSGMHADIPYIRVWGENGMAIAEFCQHEIIGVYFYPEKGDL